MGISTSLEPVLSFPLGPNSISNSEAALVYQTIMTGQVFPISPDAGLEMVPIIKQIVDREGDVMWEYESEPVKVLSRRVSGVVTGILRKVMEIGTGKKAKNAVASLALLVRAGRPSNFAMIIPAAPSEKSDRSKMAGTARPG